MIDCLFFSDVVAEMPARRRVGCVVEQSVQGDLKTVVMRSGQGHVVPDVPEELDVWDVVGVDVSDDVQ